MNYDDPYDRLTHIGLKHKLGLDLTEDDRSVVGDMSLDFAVYDKPEDIVPFLGDPERGIPRMLPVDVALSRLGMSMFKLAPDGSAERVVGKLFWARVAADRKIAEVVAKTRPPRDFFPEGAGFELLSSDMRLMIFHMHERRRLGGIVPFDDRGLFLGWWCECYSAFNVEVIAPLDPEAIFMVMIGMFVRDVVLLGPVPGHMAGVEFYEAATVAAGDRGEFGDMASILAKMERDPKHFARPVRVARCHRPALNTPLSESGHVAWRETFVSA